MNKSPEAFRTISEVADILEVPQHVLRFWESKFSQLRPMKRGGGRRYYRPEDVELLIGIRHLLYGEGYTIRGVQKILKEQGAKYVANTASQEEINPTDDEKPISVPDPVVEEQLDPIISQPNAATDNIPEIIPAEHRDKQLSASGSPDTLKKSDIKKLEDTLFELSEVRRLLKESRQS